MRTRSGITRQVVADSQGLRAHLRGARSGVEQRAACIPQQNDRGQVIAWEWVAGAVLAGRECYIMWRNAHRRSRRMRACSSTTLLKGLATTASAPACRARLVIEPAALLPIFPYHRLFAVMKIHRGSMKSKRADCVVRPRC